MRLNYASGSLANVHWGRFLSVRWKYCPLVTFRLLSIFILLTFGVLINETTETMKFTTQSGLELEATMPSISSGQYFVTINGSVFQMTEYKLKTVFESSVAKFLNSINKPCPVGLQCVALQIDEKTQKEIRAFVDSNAPSAKSSSMTRDQFNGEEGGITYHGTHEMWNGVRMD